MTSQQSMFRRRVREIVFRLKQPFEIFHWNEWSLIQIGLTKILKIGSCFIRNNLHITKHNKECGDSLNSLLIPV